MFLAKKWTQSHNIPSDCRILEKDGICQFLNTPLPNMKYTFTISCKIFYTCTYTHAHAHACCEGILEKKKIGEGKIYLE